MSKNPLLLIEDISFFGGVIKPNDVIKESFERTGKMVFENVILQRADVPNANRRVYPKRIMEKEIEVYKQLIREKRAFGTLDHPDSSVVQLADICWAITDIWWDNLEVRGNITVLSHPKGQIVQSIVNDGFTVGVSSRALGEVEKNKDGYDVVKEGLVIVAFDAVSEPSTKNAFVNPPRSIGECADAYLKRNGVYSRDSMLIRDLNQLICNNDSCDI